MAQRHDAGPVALVVEADADQAAWTREVLEAEGFIVVEASDGAQALAILDVVRPDLVVAGLLLPVLDGLAFLRRYRERPAPRPPVIAVSALASYLPEAMALGASVALAKPWDRERLAGYARSLVAGRPLPAPPVPRPPPDEVQRIRSIHELQLDRPAPGQSLARFVDRVARVFEAPICQINVILQEGSFWTAACGFPADMPREGSRELSFCTHSVASRSPLIVQDAWENPLFRENPLLRSANLRFYAGVPLFDRHGEALGTLCILDVRQRPAFGRLDLALLTSLGKRVMGELDWRELASRPREPPSTFRYLEYVDLEHGLLGRSALVEVLHAQATRMAERGRALSMIVTTVSPTRRRESLFRIEDRLDRALLGRMGLDRFGVVVPEVSLEAALREVQAAAGEDQVVLGEAVPGNPEACEEILRGLEAQLGDRGLAPGDGIPNHGAIHAEGHPSGPG